MGGGTIISILGLTGLCLGALALILWVGVSAGLIVRHRFKGSSEDETDELANGRCASRRAGRATPRARAGLGHAATIPNAIIHEGE